MPCVQWCAYFRLKNNLRSKIVYKQILLTVLKDDIDFLRFLSMDRSEKYVVKHIILICVAVVVVYLQEIGFCSNSNKN